MSERSFAVDAPGLRLDQFLARKLPELSRAHLRGLIERGAVTVDGARRDPKFRVAPGQLVRLSEVRVSWRELPFDSWIVFEDKDLLVLRKPAGIIMHPMGGSWEETPSAALSEEEANIAGLMLANRPQAAALARCGLVHRLDRHTSGVLLLAKTAAAQERLLAGFREREITKAYRAIVMGELKRTLVDAPIGRNPGNRKVQVTPWGREASTEFTCVDSARGLSLVQAEPKTGRTHQIRAHLALLKLPVLGDQEWFREPERARLAAMGLPEPPRMLLHAYKISLAHPKTGRPVSYTAPLPSDFRGYWDSVKKAR